MFTISQSKDFKMGIFIIIIKSIILTRISAISNDHFAEIHFTMMTKIILILTLHSLKPIS